MSGIALQTNASGTGTLSIVAPNTNTNRTLTLPDATTTFVGTDTTQTLTNKTIQGGAITSGTSQASTSGTSIDFTGIPSWAKRVTVMLNGISTNGTNNFQIQLGYSGGVETTGYINFASWTSVANSVGSSAATTGFVMPAWAAAATHSGSAIFTNLSGNIWACQGVSGSASGGGFVGGSKTLTGALDRVRITTTTGTDTFDAGSINILYE